MAVNSKNFWFDEAGQDAVEYALLIGFVVAASAAGIASVLTALSNLWTAINNLLSNPG
jgi:Flp pilus assembly pilin Flp